MVQAEADGVTRIFLDEQAERDFARDGYAVVRLVTAEEATALLDGLATLRNPSGRNGKRSGLYVSFMDSDRDQRRRIYHFFRDALSPRIDRVLDGYKVLAATLLDKPAGDGDMALHRDWWMSADTEDRNLIVWCPLVDTDDTNGTIRLVVGSHRLIPDLSAPHGGAYYAPYQEALMKRARSIPLRAGEALIFDATILHWSPVNGSGRARPAVNLMCLPNAAVPVFYKAQSSPEGPRFELFDMSDEGYYEHDMADFLAGTIRRKSLGFVPNRNRSLPQEECERRLAAAEARMSGRRGGVRWGERIRTLFGRPANARERQG
jgi:hypothetical protein